MSLFLMFPKYTFKLLLFTFDCSFLFISKVHVLILNGICYSQVVLQKALGQFI